MQKPIVFSGKVQDWLKERIGPSNCSLTSRLCMNQKRHQLSLPYWWHWWDASRHQLPFLVRSCVVSTRWKSWSYIYIFFFHWSQRLWRIARREQTCWVTKGRSLWFFFFFNIGTFLNVEPHFAIGDDLLALQPLSLLDVVLWQSLQFFGIDSVIPWLLSFLTSSSIQFNHL